MDQTRNTAANSTSAESDPSAQASASVNAAISSADSAVAQSMQTLALVHQARVANLSRVAAALKAQYGPEDPQVENAEAAVKASVDSAGRARIAQQELGTAAPEVPLNGWTLHGRVYDSAYQPLPKMTVFLVDATNTYQQQFGFGYTDETGYFQITALEPPATPELFLEVADQKSKPVYLSTSSLQPAIGAAVYQNVILGEGAKPIGDPPRAIRGKAIPPKAKKA
jgi:hypothetical protein